MYDFPSSVERKCLDISWKEMFSKKYFCKELTEIHVIKDGQKKKFGIFMYLFIVKIK